MGTWSTASNSEREGLAAVAFQQCYLAHTTGGMDDSVAGQSCMFQPRPADDGPEPMLLRWRASPLRAHGVQPGWTLPTLLFVTRFASGSICCPRPTLAGQSAAQGSARRGTGTHCISQWGSLTESTPLVPPTAVDAITT